MNASMGAFRRVASHSSPAQYLLRADRDSLDLQRVKIAASSAPADSLLTCSPGRPARTRKILRQRWTPASKQRFPQVVSPRSTHPPGSQAEQIIHFDNRHDLHWIDTVEDRGANRLYTLSVATMSRQMKIAPTCRRSTSHSLRTLQSAFSSAMFGK
ncbi:hypothetical protein EXIGLDRAFT_395765 [Exidia glandulosa HHB12029]|uniref:Uncharacterized protein n=1 Tax=Exidia glandulosa HHB12029 TaxID=1314781 RepID=A0A165BNR8_EXIGL|nr:hypothetical protein EXIGLDRAFT_395765 [Exidia glandulosa HHB12029]